MPAGRAPARRAKSRLVYSTIGPETIAELPHPGGLARGGVGQSAVNDPGSHRIPTTFSSPPSHSAMCPTFRTTSSQVAPLQASTLRARNALTRS